VDPVVAVLLCNGTPEFRPEPQNIMNAADWDLKQSTLQARQTAAGCMGLGDCGACAFDAMYGLLANCLLLIISVLPVVRVKACPKPDRTP
jgi:hypothetical protein